ncbi:hypothetical Protein YC6258_03503 [Gynuella sunshinyii YC6258]|uniref:Uncharacterized protein n=1 Tax=Gynuella sunshinyii YC6258 TaxID=1445510 RepID=A0A0C5VYQ3_9GAMM|nr:hypothetical Protein YC6258_03503 [Gynuella sunshinyii YC6258]
MVIAVFIKLPDALRVSGSVHTNILLSAFNDSKNPFNYHPN